MIGPMLLALTIIAICFWDKIVHKCKFKHDDYGNIKSFKNARSETAVFEGTIILFSFLISIVMVVSIFLKKIKERDRSQTGILNSAATCIEAKFEFFW